MTFLEERVRQNLAEKARRIRGHVIRMLTEAGSGHPGGSLSLVEILTVLYFYVVRHDPRNPKWEDRDRLILSKGHAAPALYATLAEAGYIPLEELSTLRKLNSRLQGHADCNVPGVELSTGSLGQGLSVANGLALAAKMQRKSSRIYVILGDGEVQEGQVWEAAMTASHHKLDNVTAIIDRNGLQQTGPTEFIKSLEPLASKWEAFGWKALMIDGYAIEDMVRAFNEAENTKGRPSVIIALTVKGKGVDFMEWVSSYHGKVPDKEKADKVLKDIEG